MKTNEYLLPNNFLKVASFKLKALALMLLITFTVNARDEYFTKRIKGNQIAETKTVDTSDVLFQKGLEPNWVALNKITYQRVTNRITLKVDTGVYSPNLYSCSVKLLVTVKDKDNRAKTYTPTLTVEFRNGTEATETDQFVYQFFGAHDVSVKITSIQTFVENTPTSNIAPPNLILENMILVKRFYEFDEGLEPPAVVVTEKNGGNQLEITWAPIAGAEEYQLEWLFVNDYNGTDVNGNLPSNQIPYDFNNNATRVTLPDSVRSYTINNVFEKGYIAFRHRGIGVTGAGNKINIPGHWSCDPCSGTIGGFTGPKRIYKTSGHQQEKINWFYTATYAEEGKKKETVNYMDGTNKSRQTVSKLNTENQTIVSETVYDKEGRAAVSIIPSPSGVNALIYNKGYNKNAGGKDYSTSDFESNASPCVNQASPLSITSGSANYFSPSNLNKKGMQAYLPNAAGYPLSQIEYTSDNTGRIKRQGGVGFDHQLNRGHEVKYYYGKPTQEQLDKLFGSEVGHYSHYKKNMVRDENKQLSVSYLDMNGRTIATALAGESQPNLDPVYGPGVLNATTVNILDNHPVVKGDKSLRSQFVYLASSLGNHTFNYKVTAPVYDDESCLTDANVCYECVYDLEISVTDECGVEKIIGGPIKRTIGVLDEYLCGPEKQLTEPPFTANLDIEGAYTINKTLTISSKALTDGLAHYIKQKKCVKTLNDFVKEEFLEIDFEACEPPLTCEESCVQSIGTELEYIVRNPGKTHNDYLKEILSCRLDCEVPPVLNSQFQALLDDMSPGGQYGDTTHGPDGRVADFASIYRVDESAPGFGNAFGVNISDEAVVKFKDETEHDIIVTLPDGSHVTPNQLFHNSLKDFVAYWQPSWAKALVQFHPEFLVWKVKNKSIYKKIDKYDMLMQHTETYEEALSLGLLNPLEITGADVPVPVSDANSVPLPFETASGEGHLDPLYSAEMTANYKVPTTNYVKDYPITKDGATIKGLWRIAAVAAVCNDAAFSSPTACASACSTYVFSPFSATDPCTIDRVWKIFRSMYLGYRVKTVQLNVGFDILLAASSPGDYRILYDKVGTSGNFANKEKRFISIKNDLELKFGEGILSYNQLDVDNNTILAQAKVVEDCDSVCRRHAEHWLSNLSGCNPGTGPWDSTNTVYRALEEKLIAVCKLGCDAAHPIGSSTVADGNPGVPSGTPGVYYKSFSDAIKGVLGLSVEKLECSSDLISTPVPYNNDSNLPTSVSIIDTCACDKILYVDQYYNSMAAAHTLPVGMTKGKLFEQIYKVELEELNGKICLCKSAFAKGGILDWSMNANWSIAGVNALLTSKEPVPSEINCEKCTNCTKVKQLVNAFKATVEAQNGGSIPPDKMDLYRTNLNNHLNKLLNLNLSMVDYDLFIKECDKALEGSYSCVAGPAAKELEKLLNIIVFENKLLKSAKLCESPYTPATPFDRIKWDFSYKDLLASKVDPTFVSGDCNQVYCFVDTNGTDLTGKILKDGNNACQLELHFTEAGFEFENIRRITDLTIDPKNNGNNYHFLIHAIVSVDDKMVETTLTGKTTCIPLGECSNDNSLLTLCEKELDIPNNCVEELTEEAFSNAQILYRNYINGVKNEFITRYTNKCIKAGDEEEFNMTFQDGEYHYTLYYYNQAGNLVRTVPPEGVELLTKSQTNKIASDRKNNKERSVFTQHRMATNYEYNSLNQLISQSVPDHDKLNDWLTFNRTSGLIPNLVVKKAQTNKDGGTYLIATDPADPSKSLIFYAAIGEAWTPVNDIGLGNLSATHFFGSTGYAVSEKGMLLKTTDGTTWTVSSTGINEDLKEVYFSSASNGIIITKSVKVYSTNNGGSTWSLVSSSGLDLDDLNELTFGTTTNGIAVGRKGVLGAAFKTINGGLTWTPSTSFTTTDLKTIHMLPDNKTLFAAGTSGTLIKSINSGQDWSEINSSLTIALKEINFFTDLVGCGLGEDGNLYVTNSGGNTWDITKTPAAGDVYVDIYFDPATDRGYALSQKGEVLITNMNAAVWNKIYKINPGVNMLSVFFENQYVGYAGGESGKLHKITLDEFGIYHANEITTNMSMGFTNLHYNGNLGSAILTNGLPVKTSNNTIWTTNAPFAATYISSSFSAPDKGILVSTNGKTAYTITSGQTWLLGTDLPVSLVAKAVTVGNDGNALVVGNGGTIFSAANYGATTWTTNTQKVKPLVLRGAFMKNASTAYAVGYGGSFYKSADGGNNWTAVATGSTAGLEDVGEINNNIILNGNYGLIRVSTNITPSLPVWENKNIPAATAQNKRIAFGATKGYITTMDGKILISSDYGLNWSVYYTGTAGLNDIHMISDALGYAVGAKGTIIKITPAPAVSLLQSIHPAKLHDTHCEGNFAIAVGKGIILRSEDGGQAWKNSVASPSAGMRAVCFVKPASGTTPDNILIAGNGLVLRSTDGGIIFNTVSSPAITAGTKLSAMCMTSNEKIYAVGDNGVIRRSSDSGQTWEVVTSPVAVDLTSIIIKGKTGFITGKSGTILKSDDVFAGSPNWTNLQAPGNQSWVKYITHLDPPPALNSVYFHDLTTGYVAGDKGIVLKTMNGGNSWQQMPITGADSLKYITFSSNGDGAIFGSNTTSLTVQDENDNTSTRFYYDRLGRLVASQNTKQHHMALPRYSYTRYDEQNRIIETGEMETHITVLEKYRLNSPNFPDNISVNKYNVVNTYYDAPYKQEINGFFGAGGQQNLRGRIATITIREVYDASKLYDHATHYSYDVHGNVKSVIQDNPDLDNL